MTIPKITPYSGGVANPDGSQTQTEFTQNMFDQLSYEAELSTELNNTVDGINDTATQVNADATSAAQSAAAAEAAVSGLSYQGLWPDTGGSADKGDTYQTQVSGTPTGKYFTALQNTTVDPVGDNVNWRYVSSSYIRMVDLIVSAGQSNAEGRGEVYNSESAVSGLFFDGSAFSKLQDPVGGASDGSMWPAFSNEWNRQTGREVVVIDTAVGGSALSNSGAWSPVGNLRQNAVDAANTAIQAIHDNPDLFLNSVRFVWLQGESDADNGVSKATYRDDLIALASFFRANVEDTEPVAVCMIGRVGGSGGDPRDDAAAENNRIEIRKAQYEACGLSGDLVMAYTGAATYLGQYEMNDGLHFNQSALNKIGRACALNISNPYDEGSFGTSKKSPYLASHSASSSPDEILTELSFTVTTNIYTDTIIIVATCMRINATNQTISCTVNGMPIRRIVRSRIAEVNGITSSAFEITSDDYSFYGISELNITVKSSANSNFIAATAHELQGASYVGDVNLKQSSGNISNADTDIGTYEPSVIISSVCTMGDGVTPIVTSYTGATKDSDVTSYNTATSRNMSHSSAHFETNVKTSSNLTQASISSPQTELSMMSFAMRRKKRGE